jgi:hypothetical protein
LNGDDYLAAAKKGMLDCPLKKSNTKAIANLQKITNTAICGAFQIKFLRRGGTRKRLESYV